MAGIDNVMHTIEAVGEIVVDVAFLVKQGGIGIGGFGKVMEIFTDVKVLVESATAALPELSDLDSVEAGHLATAAYLQVKRIVAAVVA